MGSRTGHLVFRLLQRHLLAPGPGLKHSGQIAGVLGRDATGVVAGRSRLLDSTSFRGVQKESSGRLAQVERNDFGLFFKQPNSAFLSLSRVNDTAGAQSPAVMQVPVGPASGGERSEPVWGFRLGLRLRSGMYLPSAHQEEGMEASSVKRKRKKKMNKHKQRKLRRRDRHRN